MKNADRFHSLCRQAFYTAKRFDWNITNELLTREEMIPEHSRELIFQTVFSKALERLLDEADAEMEAKLNE